MTRDRIAKTARDEREALLALHAECFPDEDLGPLVDDLLGLGNAVMSLAARAGGGEGPSPVAHVLFTRCGPDGRGALLGPLCVAPARRGGGLGRDLIEEGCGRLAEAGVGQVFVLGDPAFYGRFGFAAETRVAPPFPLPAEWSGAWQSRLLGGGEPLPPGPLALPDPWMDRALWTP